MAKLAFNDHPSTASFYQLGEETYRAAFCGRKRFWKKPFYFLKYVTTPLAFLFPQICDFFVQGTTPLAIYGRTKWKEKREQNGRKLTGQHSLHGSILFPQICYICKMSTKLRHMK